MDLINNQPIIFSRRDARRRAAQLFMTLDWDGGVGQNQCQVSRRERPWWGKIGAGH